MIGRMLAKLVWIMVFPVREPDFLIGGSSEDPYMRRWWLIPRNRFFNIYLHHIRHDDDDRAPHDHPWISVSLCLQGWIREFELISSELGFYRLNDIRAGGFKFRNSTFAHRLTLPEGEAWTLFITGPKIRDWGFHCRGGWVPFQNFIDPKDHGKVGRGCGELA